MKAVSYNYEKYRKARKTVDEQKGFYIHLLVYIVINITIFLFRKSILDYIAGNAGEIDGNFVDWLDLNILLTPFFWGAVLLIHYLIIFGFKPGFLKRWEERQIQKYIEKDKREVNKYK